MAEGSYKLNATARKELAVLAKKHGLDVEAANGRAQHKSHLNFYTEPFTAFAKVVVQGGKTRFRERLAEACAFASMDSSGETTGVVFQRRDDDPWVAVVTAEDFFSMIALIHGNNADPTG